MIVDFFFSAFRKITVGGFVNQLIKKSAPTTLFCFCYCRLKKNILTLDNIVQMMLQMNLTRDWNKAFEYLPPRFWDIKYGRSLPFKRDPAANRRPLPFKRDPLSDI